MKKRYYLSMLSIFLLILIFDIVYFTIHKTFVLFLISSLTHIIIYVLINIIGIIWLYKPIDRLFVENDKCEKTINRISNLSKYSAFWIFFLGMIYVVFTILVMILFPTDFEGYSLDKMPSIMWLTILPSTFFLSAVFPAFISYFIINDFSLDLKSKVFCDFQITYPVGKRRMGILLLSVFFLLGFFPTLLVILELTISGSGEKYAQFMSTELLQTVLADRFIVLVGMILSIVLITRSFTKPIYSLLANINKVSDGDYSTTTAIITDDEIGLLTKSFNNMVYEHESSYRKQKEYSQTLEKNLEKLNNEITEREKAEELSRQHQKKLFQSEKMASVGILVSGVAHEINNPNNFTLLNCDNLLDVWNDLIPFLDKYSEKHGDFIVAGLLYSEIRDEVSMIIKGVKGGSLRIKKIVQTLKDFVRKDQGNLDQIVDISDAIDDSVTILTSLIKKSTDQFTTNVLEKLPNIMGNKQQIEQVIINLLSNSCQALENKENKIKISTAFDDSSVSIIVADEGIGISPENLKYIIDPFFTTKRDSGGTGLGLSISYNIIKEHGGELIIKSEIGKGTIAKIKLPIRV